MSVELLNRNDRERRHSSFYFGLYGDTWVNFWSSCVQQITQLMELNRNKRLFHSARSTGYELD